MKTPKPPPAPDPVKTAQAQAGVNLSTAMAQQNMNMIGQVNPWGTVNYTQNGNTRFRDSFGNWVEIPQYTQTTTFTPEQQAIFDKSQGAQSNLAGIAQDQSARIADTLSDPFEFNNQDAADWAYDLSMSRLRPEMENRQEALRSQLINSGLRPGTDAYGTEMSRIGQVDNDMMNQLMLQGRGQAFSEQLATRNQPLNELSALLSGSQVSNPAGMSGPTPQTSVGGVDYSGMVQNNYNNQMQQYNAQMQNRGGMLGGLFGLAGSLGSAAITSDIRLKTDIARVGTLDNGLPVYSYRYKSGGPIHIGVMAHEVEAVHPEAVVEIGGFKAVDYARAVA